MPRESPNRKAIGLVMFIYFVDLVESKIFFEFWSLFFGFCGQRSVPTQRATVHLHCLDTQLESCFLLLVLVPSSWLGYGRECAFLDGTMSRCSLWDEI